MSTIEHHYGSYLINGHLGESRSELIQTDWDYPATAERFGWSLRRVQKHPRTGIVRRLKRAPNRGHGCDHSSTDGTVTCSSCGITASEFIAAAESFLDSLC